MADSSCRVSTYVVHLVHEKDTSAVLEKSSNLTQQRTSEATSGGFAEASQGLGLRPQDVLLNLPGGGLCCA